MLNAPRFANPQCMENSSNHTRVFPTPRGPMRSMELFSPGTSTVDVRRDSSFLTTYPLNHMGLVHIIKLNWNWTEFWILSRSIRHIICLDLALLMRIVISSNFESLLNHTASQSCIVGPRKAITRGMQKIMNMALIWLLTLQYLHLASFRQIQNPLKRLQLQTFWRLGLNGMMSSEIPAASKMRSLRPGRYSSRPAAIVEAVSTSWCISNCSLLSACGTLSRFWSWVSSKLDPKSCSSCAAAWFGSPSLLILICWSSSLAAPAAGSGLAVLASAWWEQWLDVRCTQDLAIADSYIVCAGLCIPSMVDCAW